jgi:hypothetical protein
MSPTRICARCHERCPCDERGRILPHELASGLRCGSRLDRIVHVWSPRPERTSAPLARLISRNGYTVDTIELTPGRSLQSVIYWINPETFVSESTTNPILHFYLVGVVNEGGECFVKYTEAAPWEAPPTGEPLGESAITYRSEDQAAIPPTSLARSLAEWLFGRSDNR